MLLKVDKVKKQYEGQLSLAVDSVSLSVQKGEVVALVGESGSGKSTLLNLISGLLDPDEGEIYFQNERVKGPVDKLVPGHEEIKVVFQHYDLMPFHTVEDNIRFVIRNFDEEFQEEKLKVLTEVCAMEGFLHKKPGELSGGQQQRVAIAKALASEPELLLMDEPFSSVDSQLKAHLEAAVFDYVKTYNMTCVFVTHDHHDALSLSDRIIVLKQGQLISDGEPYTTYFNPVDAYVASFFGAVNIYKGSIWNSLVGNEVCEPNKMYLLRGEFLEITSNGLKAKVHQKLFMGHYDKLILKAHEIKLQIFSTPNTYKVGQAVQLSFDPQNLTPLS